MKRMFYYLKLCMAVHILKTVKGLYKLEGKAQYYGNRLDMRAFQNKCHSLVYAHVQNALKSQLNYSDPFGFSGQGTNKPSLPLVVSV